MDNDRTKTAREHDDSDLIENAEGAPGHQDRSGGNIHRDVGTQATIKRVDEPEAQEGVTKEDDIAHGQRRPVNRPGDMTP